MGEDKMIAPIAQPFYIYPGLECTAKSYQSFEFLSWQENLGGNSSQMISIVPPPSIVDYILDFFYVNPDKPQATLNITKFGSFTANFKPSSSFPLPTNQFVTLNICMELIL
jgi:hypothetical protein